MKNIMYISFLLLFVFFNSLNAKVEEEIINFKEITFDCLTLGRYSIGEHIVKNNIEYQKLFFYCTKNQLPIIDFTKYTLIGYVSSVSGCQLPKVTKEINKINKTYQVDINIVKQGSCKKNNPIIFWGLIPKIDDNDDIQFTILNN